MPEDPLFPPLPTVTVPDAGSRLASAGREVRRRRRRRAGVAAGSATALAVAAVAVVVPLPRASSAPDVVMAATPTVAADPSESAAPSRGLPATSPVVAPDARPSTTPATSPSSALLPPAAPVSAAPTTAQPTTKITPTTPTTRPTPTGPPATGTVTDASGAPLAGEYVIGLDDFTTVRTDAQGHFSLPCSGSGQPVVVADWDIPLLHPGSVDESEGAGANHYAVPTSWAGVGDAYVFGPTGTSATTADQAPTLACGARQTYVLQTGGRLVVTFTSPGGKPLPAGASSSVELPSLGGYTFYATLPVSKQVDLPGLPAGDVTFASTYPATSDCSGSGVTYDGDFIFTVAVVAGQTTTLSCTLPAGY